LLLVDVAVGSNTLVDLSPLAAIGAQLHKLESADVAFTGNGSDAPVTVGIEVKSIPDMLASLENGRLNGIDGQLAKMCDTYDIRWLLAYGFTRPNPLTGALQVGRTWAQKGHSERVTVEWSDYGYGKRPVPYSYLDGFLLSPSFTRLGVLYKQVGTLDDVGWWLATLYKCWQKPYADHRALHTFDTSREVKPPTIKPPTRATLQRAKTAASLPSIGYERAWPVAEHFRSLAHMFTAPASEWAEIATTTEAGKRRRLGPVVAAAVTRVIGDVEK
jgi:hypothetical protein